MQQITPYLFYEDIEAALEFLARAFGFQETLRYRGAQGYVSHAEMRLGDGTIMLGDPGEQYRNPRRRSGEVSGAVHVAVQDVQATYELALAAGAQIVEPPADQPYGRRFGARDPEGHEWWFSQQASSLAPEDWGAAE